MYKAISNRVWRSRPFLNVSERCLDAGPSLKRPALSSPSPKRAPQRPPPLPSHEPIAFGLAARGGGPPPLPSLLAAAVQPEPEPQQPDELPAATQMQEEQEEEREEEHGQKVEQPPGSPVALSAPAASPAGTPVRTSTAEFIRSRAVRAAMPSRCDSFLLACFRILKDSCSLWRMFLSMGLMLCASCSTPNSNVHAPR